MISRQALVFVPVLLLAACGGSAAASASTSGSASASPSAASQAASAPIVKPSAAATVLPGPKTAKVGQTVSAKNGLKLTVTKVQAPFPGISSRNPNTESFWRLPSS